MADGESPLVMAIVIIWLDGWTDHAIDGDGDGDGLLD